MERKDLLSETWSVDTGEEAGAAIAPWRIACQVGDLLGGRFEIEAELGRGGSSVVYRARDRVAGTSVALKLITRGARGAAEQARLGRELRIARSVTHPAVVRIYDLVEIEDRLALSMELVPGPSLAEVLARGEGRSPDEITRLARDLADGLAALHAVGVTHRDLKPANVLLRPPEGRGVITDLGAATLGDAEDGLVGTPRYMAPEQLDRRADILPAADVFAFGLLLVECATGEVPPPEARRSAPPPLASRRPDLPVHLCSLVDQCLSPDPAARPPDGTALRAALASAPVRAWLRPAASTALVAAVAVIAFVVLARTETPVPWIPEATGLTHEVENLDRAAVSPDGRTLAIASTRGGDWDIWIGDPGAGALRPLTSDAITDQSPVFVDGGRAVVFARLGEGVGVYRVDAQGIERPERLATATSSRIAATPDGREVLYRRTETTWALLDLATRASRDVFSLAPDRTPVDVAISGDGRIAIAARSGDRDPSLVVVDLRTGQPRELPGVVATSAGFVPGDPGAIVVTRRRQGASSLAVHFLDGRPPRTILGEGLGGEPLYPSVSRDGRRLVYNHDETTVQVMARHRDGTWARVTSDVKHHLYPLLDAQRGRLYDIEVTGGDRRLRVRDWPTRADAGAFEIEHEVVGAALANDALFLALVREGRLEIARVQPDGRTEARASLAGQEVCSSISVDAAATHAAVSRRAEGVGLWLVPLNGGAPRAAITAPTCNARFSPVNPEQVAFVRLAVADAARIEVLDVRSGVSRVIAQLPHGHSYPMEWAPSGDALYVVRNDLNRIDKLATIDGTELERIPMPEPAESLGVARDGTLLLGAVIGRSRVFEIANFAEARR